MKNGNNNSVYKQMQRMADLTIAMVLKGKLIRAKKFLDTAEKLFLRGNYQTRNAVANVYVYNISAILELHHCDMQTLLPQSLQKEYIKQSNAF